MREIGGYFGLEQLISNEYYKDLIALNTARNSLLYVLKARNIKRLYIPNYLCDSVSGICNREGYSYGFYHIGYDFLPVFDFPLKEDEYIYIVNYYGQISNEQVKELQKKYKRIIFDNVQAFFQKPVEGIDTIYSCRKFFGVPDGAYLSTDCLLNEELKTDRSSERMTHILGRFEIGSASEFYRVFKENDESYDRVDLMKMSKLTHNILGAIDYEKVRSARERNFCLLHEALYEQNKLTIKTPIAPYAYPFYCENGIEARKRLAKNKIYVPTLWPNVLDSEDILAKDYAECVLPLPCDQRYKKEEMQIIIKEVTKCID